jgi:hypothetical protein
LPFPNQYSEQVLKQRSINEVIHIASDFFESPLFFSQTIGKLNGKTVFGKLLFNIPASAEVEEFVINEPFFKKRICLIRKK